MDEHKFTERYEDWLNNQSVDRLYEICKVLLYLPDICASESYGRVRDEMKRYLHRTP